MKSHILAALAAILVTTAVAFTGYRAGVNATLADQARYEARLQAVEERAQAGAAKAIASLKVQNKTIYNEVQRETRIVPDYSACRHSDVGLHAVNAALEGKPLGAGSGELPGADAPR